MFYIDNKPVCILWFGKDTYEVANTRCDDRVGSLLEIQNETPIPSLLRKYGNTKAGLTSFWVRYQDGIRVFKADGIDEVHNGIPSNRTVHGILCMKKPIYPYKEHDTTSRIEFSNSRENWYRVTNTNTYSTKFLARKDSCANYDANSVSDGEFGNFAECNFDSANTCSKDYYRECLIISFMKIYWI